MPNHMPEPWKASEFIGGNGLAIVANEEIIGRIYPHLQESANAIRLVTCVNGCAGLNPTAYREVVEALKKIVNEPIPLSMGNAEFIGQMVTIAKQALRHATEER